jgi:hypothetical protein
VDHGKDRGTIADGYGVRRIGYLSPTAGFSPVDEAFEKSLQQHGWVRGRNIEIEYRYTGGLRLLYDVVSRGQGAECRFDHL